MEVPRDSRVLNDQELFCPQGKTRSISSESGIGLAGKGKPNRKEGNAGEVALAQSRSSKVLVFRKCQKRQI
ncbi:hypothetical protein J6590_049183 [Homalodisca vitripennis]|nr:hypothetical protein J6590_049183 [Homalodisca vitripennis]